MLRAFVGMGSNLGDGKATLQGAWHALAEVEGIELVTISSPYQTEPVDMKSHHWFTNAVGEIRTRLQPLDLLRHLLRIEADFGRVRDKKVFGLQDRSLDLDLLYVEGVIIDIPELILPHPRAAERLFVMAPMAEIAPDFVDSLKRKTIRELHDSLKEQMETGAVKKQEIILSSWKN